jgi:excisionase family DNA binding protein
VQRDRARLKPLISVEEAAELLGCSRSSLYRSISRGDIPVPFVTINGRYRIPRAAVDRLLAGELPTVAMFEAGRPGTETALRPSCPVAAVAKAHG